MLGVTLIASLILAASGIAGKPVTIGCDLSYTEVPALGLADVRGDHARLLPSGCLLVNAFAAGDRPVLRGDWRKNSTRILGQPLALLVMVHESYHLSGIGDEAQTECYALQRLQSVAVELGATQQYAREVVGRAYAAEQMILPAEYHDTVNCRRDGAWDLHIGQWPEPWFSEFLTDHGRTE